MSGTRTDRGPAPLDELAALVARASVLQMELATIKAQSPARLFVYKLRGPLPPSVDLTREHRAPQTIVAREVPLTVEESARVSDLVDGLRLAVALLEGERAAIAAESALGLSVRKALRRMPPAGALPVFSWRRLERGRALARRSLRNPLQRLVTKSGRFALRGYRRLRVAPMGQPRITVVTPVYDGASHVATTIRSVLAQHYPNLQYIVADAGSTAATREIVASFDDAVDALSVRGCTIDDAVAQAFGRADGEIFACVYPGDELEPKALERVGRFFTGHARVGAISFETIIDNNGWRFPSADRAPSGSVFVRRSAYAVGAGKNAVVSRPGHVAVCRTHVERPASTPARSSRRAAAREHGRLFFPLDEVQSPPAVVAPPLPAESPPVCPLSGCVPDRLLFSSPDTRLGYDPVTYVYYVPESQMAIAYPRIAGELIAERWTRAAWNPERTIRPAAGTSPYRNYAPRGLLPALAARWALPVVRASRVDADPGGDSVREVILALRTCGIRRSDPRSFLNIGPAEATLPGRLRDATRWRVSSVEDAERAGSAFPLDDRFDVVRIDGIERCDDPVAALAAATTVLAVRGKLIIATPNLDSAHIEMFGPAWSGWRPPYHRHVFGRTALRLLAARTNMRVVRLFTVSRPTATAMSLLQRRHGLAAIVPEDIAIPPDVLCKAETICDWSRLLFDPWGRGDRIVAVLEKRP